MSSTFCSEVNYILVYMHSYVHKNPKIFQNQVYVARQNYR